MVSEVVSAIRDAEKEAESIIEKSKQKARDISAATAADCMSAMRKSEIAARKEAAAMVERAEDYARKRSVVLLEKNQANCDALKEAARANMPDAVEFILRGAE